MDLTSPIFDRIRAKPKAKQEPVQTVKVRCDHPGCNEHGEFRAPMGWQREGQYFSFCLEHVRAYNASYNYFQGMSADAVAFYQRDATTGHRPTWVMGNNGPGGPRVRGADSSQYIDPLDIFAGRAAQKPQAPPKPKHGIAARKALDQLGLDENADSVTIRNRYKDMVKRLHPDANGGDRSLEDKLREIIRAYSYLKSVKLA